mgnify:CR=1 FL=1
MASPGREGALQTPRADGQAGILRSPRTPGTGSSVRFGMRIYETGEESVLSASQGSSIYPAKDADASASMQLSDMSNLDEQHTSLQESMSMEMSFTESFLKREVGDALAGLAQSTSEPLLPTTPGAKQTLPAPAPDTVRARIVSNTIQEESRSPSSSPRLEEPTMRVSESKRSPSTSPLSSPTPRHAEVADDEDSLEHEAPLSSPTYRLPTPPAQPPAEPVSVASQSTSTPPVSPPPSLKRQSLSFVGGTSTSPVHSPPPVVQSQTRGPLDVKEKQDDVEVAPAATSSSAARPSAQQDALPMQGAGPSTSQTTSPTMRARPAASHSSAQEQPRVAAPAVQTPTSTSRSLSRIGTPKSRLGSSHRSRRTTPDRDASYMTSFASWATPRSDASVLHSPDASDKAKHAEGWPGVYEFSYLTEKDELDEEEAGELVPYALEELTNKLVSIESLGNVDARELLETVAQLDRTHTERTIFLQHRLARSYRLNQVLRSNLRHAQERMAAFESHVTGLLDHQPVSDAPAAEELRRLAMQLEERLQMLPAAPMLAIEPSHDDDARDTERASLEEARAELVREQEAHEAAQTHFNQARAQLDLERIQLQDEWRRVEQEQAELKQAHLQLDMERRDLEIRLAAHPTPHAVSEEEVERRIAHAVAVARESALRDAEVRRAQAQPSAPSEGDAALRAEIDKIQAELERRTQEADDVIASLQSEVESLHAKLAEPQGGEAWEAHVAELERMLDEAEADAQAAQESFHNQELERLELQTQLEERVAELENQVHDGAEAVLRLSKARQESEAELTATIHNQRKRIHALEHDVAHRGLELVKLEKQKENLTKEAMHFSLALSAKDQELQMLKRGTQNATAHWKALVQRNVPERRALQPKATNSARRVSSEAAKRMVQHTSPSVGLASTPNPVRRDVERRLPSVPSKGLPDLSTSTIASVELSYRP